MRNYLFALLSVIGLTAFATELESAVYTATIDLTVVTNDRVKVTVEVPKVIQKSIVYCIPKIVPGTYHIYDFGRFVIDFKAYDTKGEPLNFEMIDVNQFKIANATTLNKIEYWVDDTYDMTQDNPIFEPAGTNIASDNYLINT